MDNDVWVVKPIFEFEIEGEPASKANSRRLVKFGNRIASIKSVKASAYAKSFAEQCPELNPLLDMPLWLNIDIWYSTLRPDLDESIVLDAMQGKIYLNDRQVWGRTTRRFICKDRPRCKITVCLVEEGISSSLPRRNKRPNNQV